MNSIELEKEIINKIGNNKTKEYHFDNELDLVDKDGEKTKAYSFYTYRGQVCILDDQGMDVTFDNYQLKSQNLIHSEIIAGNYQK
jgi:hypothetical protein